MKWKNWTQLIAAVIVIAGCVFIGHLVLPVLTGMTPVIGWTLGAVIVIVLASIGLGFPAAIVISLRALHTHHAIKEIEARKLAANDRGFMPGYITRREQILIPQLVAHSVEVPSTYHIEEDNSESSGADAAQLASRILTEARNLIGGKYDQKQLPGASTIARPSQETIIGQLPYNQFVVSPGVNAETGEIVLVNLLEVPHVKFIGAPGFGKSCLAASVLDQLTQTNDRQHVQLALLDCEHKTSKLFEGNDNIAQLRIGGRVVDLVATHADMVAVQLGFLKREMMRRAELSEGELDLQPVIIMYVEEMLSLQYEVDPKLLQQMVDDILILAVRARKYRMFLLSCMQTDYSTTEMKVSQKMYRFRGAAAIDPTAARAAGFQNTDLIKANFARGQKGQFVIEYPGFSNVVLVASYDVKKKLQQLEPSFGGRSAAHAPIASDEGDFETERDRVIVDADEPETDDLQPRPSAPFYQEMGVNAPAEPTYRRTETEPKRYLLSQDEIGQFVAAYKASGSIEKALDAIGKSGRYKAHGSEIVRVFNLRKEA